MCDVILSFYNVVLLSITVSLVIFFETHICF